MDNRQRIISSFKELAVARGFSRVTVDDLASHTGMSKRTIYRYFRSKEEIINSVLDDFMSATSQSVQQALDSSANPVEKIVKVIKVITENIKFIQTSALYDLQKYYPNLWEKIEQFRAERINRIFINLLSNDEHNCFRKVNPKIFTTALMASARAVANPAFITENNLTLEETVQSLFTIFLYGIVDSGGESPHS